MAYNEPFTNRIREALIDVPRVTERKMFRGIAFMVNGKLCLSVGDQEMMCRIDSAIHAEAIEKNGVRTLKMRGKDYIGWIYVHEDELVGKKRLDYWIGLALDFNKRAKASVKKKSKAKILKKKVKSSKSKR